MNPKNSNKIFCSSYSAPLQITTVMSLRPMGMTKGAWSAELAVEELKGKGQEDAEDNTSTFISCVRRGKVLVVTVFCSATGGATVS